MHRKSKSPPAQLNDKLSGTAVPCKLAYKLLLFNYNMIFTMKCC